MKRLFFTSYVMLSISACLPLLHVCILSTLFSYITYLCVVASASATISSAAQLESPVVRGRSSVASAAPAVPEQPPVLTARRAGRSSSQSTVKRRSGVDFIYILLLF